VAVFVIVPASQHGGLDGQTGYLKAIEYGGAKHINAHESNP
jgi:hypothetical protein